MGTIVEEVLDDVLCKKFHNVQSGVRSVLYIVVDQVILDLLCKDVIEETLDLDIAKLFYTDEAAEGLTSKMLLTSNSFVAPSEIIDRRKQIRQSRTRKGVLQ